MRRSMLRCHTLAVVVLPGIVACAERPREPTGVPSVPSPPRTVGFQPAPLPPAPTISGPAVLYERRSPSAFGWTDAYLLSTGADSTFLIVGPRNETSWALAGRYARADSVLTFRYNGWNVQGPWEARGIVRGDSLILRYNAVMIGSDFEDGVYVRLPLPP
jgi:hypothetical protein